MGERSEPLLDRTILLITSGGRSGINKTNSFLNLEEISDSKAINPMKNNMFIELKK